MLSNADNTTKSIMETFGGVDKNILLQELIKESNGEDIRCFVIDDRFVASIIRKGKKGNFRSNLHQSGNFDIVNITDTERDTAIAAAKAMGLNVCGVDILRSSRGPVVMKVNSSPGSKGIEKATGINVEKDMIIFIKQNVGAVGEKQVSYQKPVL